jgi:tRNA pseudouridine55 synthase
MARRMHKKGRPVSGWLILDKPEGMGSTEAVSMAKRLYQADKAGHAGTLDPLASGLLPIALGEATKTVPYVMEGTKVYRFTVNWGEERSTDDREGAATATSDMRPDEAAIRALLPRYTGAISQVPPRFSAIKIDGARAYDLAREGETIEIPARPVTVFRLDLVGMPDADHAVFEAECGKGTYVRSLARDFGRDLGCYGHISALRRVEVAPFVEDDMVTVADLEAAAPAASDTAEGPPPPADKSRFEALDGLLIETSGALECLPHVALSDDQAVKIRLGNTVILRGRDAPVAADEAYATARGRLVAIGEIAQGQFKPKRVFSGKA